MNNNKLLLCFNVFMSSEDYSSNEKLLTDITKKPCQDGILFVTPIFDCFGCEIISLAIDNHMREDLCIKALKEAYRLRNPGNAVIINSDSGN